MARLVTINQAIHAYQEDIGYGLIKHWSETRWFVPKTAELLARYATTTRPIYHALFKLNRATYTTTTLNRNALHSSNHTFFTLTIRTSYNLTHFTQFHALHPSARIPLKVTHLTHNPHTKIYYKKRRISLQIPESSTNFIHDGRNSRMGNFLSFGSWKYADVYT